MKFIIIMKIIYFMPYSCAKLNAFFNCKRVYCDTANDARMYESIANIGPIVVHDVIACR